MVQISVIVPSLNEADAIASVLSPLQAWRRAGHEVIVVDGNSTDPTRTLAAPLAIAVSPPVRAGRRS